MSRSSPDNFRRKTRRAFTLIELIFVLALLAIVATFVATRMNAFFRGRALNEEARRMLSLLQYGQSRAVSEGVPISFWVDPKTSTYGLSILASYRGNDDDPRARVYTAEPGLMLEIPANTVPVVSEQDDENLGQPEGMTVVRINPDGFTDRSEEHTSELQSH